MFAVCDVPSGLIYRHNLGVVSKPITSSTSRSQSLASLLSIKAGHSYSEIRFAELVHDFTTQV